MSQVIPFALSDSDVIELKAVISACTAEIKRAHKAMRQDQAEIDRLKEETSQIAVETRFILDGLKKAA